MNATWVGEKICVSGEIKADNKLLKIEGGQLGFLKVDVGFKQKQSIIFE